MNLHQQIMVKFAAEAFAKAQRKHFTRWMRESRRETKATVYRRAALSGGGVQERFRRARQVTAQSLTWANGLVPAFSRGFAVAA